MVFARLFLFLNGLLGVALGGFVAVSSDLSLLDIKLSGSALIEVRTAMGGAWLALGLFWLASTFGRRLRSAIGSLTGFYAVTAVVRVLAMQAGGSTDTTLIFLAFEVVVALIGGWLFARTLSPTKRRIFSSSGL